MPSLLVELQRRNVFRVGVAYCVLGWLVIQITDTVAPALRLPDWTLTVVTWFGVIGFPFVLLFAWAFEMTPEGLKRTEDVSPEESVTRDTGRRLTQITLALMAGVIVFLLVDRQGLLGPVEQEAASPVVAPEPVPVTAPVDDVLDSIAVLPFVNMSADQENQFFGDGLAEEILNQLAAIEELRVAARTSSFYFRDKDPTIAEVAEALDVDVVLEGSIQRSGNTIRVVAQLIRASDSAHLWSSKYDRPLDDYFEVQDDIANHIMQAMMPHLSVEHASASELGEVISPEVFAQLAAAKKQYYDLPGPSTPELRQAFAAITQVAPDYAAGWSWLAMNWLASSSDFGGDVPEEEARAQAVAAAERALVLDETDPVAHQVMGRVQWRLGNNEEAEQWFQKAVKLGPQDVGIMVQYSAFLAFTGRSQEGVELLEKARNLDPLHPMVLLSLAHLYSLMGEDHAAYASLERLAMVSPAQAVDMEIHLYEDHGELARYVYLLELTVDSRQLGKAIAHNWDAHALVRAGLYSHPRIAGSSYETLALALQGQGELAATRAGEERLSSSDNIFDKYALALTYLALEQYEEARSYLWAGWQENGGKISTSFNESGAELLLMSLVRLGEHSEAEEIRNALAESLSDRSPLHSGSLKRDAMYLASYGGETEKAIALLHELVEEGYWGDRHLGMLEKSLWPLREHKDFPALLAGMERNYQYQMSELDRLRTAGLDPAQLQRDYLNRIDRRTSGPLP